LTTKEDPVEPEEPDAKSGDIGFEITNGKKVVIDLDPLEWIIVSTAICAFAWITGLML